MLVSFPKAYTVFKHYYRLKGSPAQTSTVASAMTTTQVTGMSLQLGNAPDKGVMIVHLTMTIPLLDLIAVIPDDVEHREPRRREPADATEQLFWKQVSAVPEASCRTPTYVE